MAQSFQRFNSLARAMEMTVCMYSSLQSFPKEELYGFVTVAPRSVSVASNIAEGEEG
jgi:four helix bundle protein